MASVETSILKLGQHSNGMLLTRDRAVPLLEQPDEIKQRGSGDSVIEDLQEDTAQGCMRVIGTRRPWFDRGKDSFQGGAAARARA